jgi:hypothetical protein
MPLDRHGHILVAIVGCLVCSQFCLLVGPRVYPGSRGTPGVPGYTLFRLSHILKVSNRNQNTLSVPGCGYSARCFGFGLGRLGGRFVVCRSVLSRRVRAGR